jgi:hypothetical protein
MTFSRIAAVALAFAAFVMPTAAFAQPADMHASTAIAAQQEQQQQRQDRRSPDARDAAQQSLQQQDGRSPDARDAAQNPRSPGHPSQVASVPAAEPSNGGSGVDWMPIALAAGIALLAICGVGAVATRRTRVPV